MVITNNHLSPFIDTLRKINLAQPETDIIRQVSPIVREALASASDWLEERFYKVDEAQGFGSHLVAENPDHTLAVIITAWPAHRETPPHDHDTWAVIGCVKGCEQNTLWHRHDDRKNIEYADITRGPTTTCHPGDVITMRSNDIHSVCNPVDNTISISLHVYGKHFNHTNRHQFDPATKTAKPFVVRQ